MWHRCIYSMDRQGRIDQILRGDQAYDISVSLVVPTSQRNVGIGNFMVTVTLLDRQDRLITTSSRSSIVTYESLPLRLMRTIWRAVPLVLRLSKESQTIKVIVMEKFKENSHNPVVRAVVDISNAELMIYKCTLNIDAHFQGLRYFMYYYRISTALVFMSLFIFWEMVFTILTWQVLSEFFGTKNEDSVALAGHGQGPQLQHQHPQHGQYAFRSPMTYATTRAAPTISAPTTSRLQMRSLWPVPRQPQLQEDPYLASESERSGGDDEVDDELLEGDVTEERVMSSGRLGRTTGPRSKIAEDTVVPGNEGRVQEGHLPVLAASGSANPVEGGALDDQRSFSSGHLVSEDEIESLDENVEGGGVMDASGQDGLFHEQGISTATSVSLERSVRSRRRPVA
ncbi:Berardinelli-Seip congenital lipodystrophy 2 (seipin) [Gryganskiella cystojenkinii]|nr:Berardinelli-Seip congenital lipodystrophy 2 (seipin) [Gryganskiella cystojenkinii]